VEPQKKETQNAKTMSSLVKIGDYRENEMSGDCLKKKPWPKQKIPRPRKESTKQSNLRKRNHDQDGSLFRTDLKQGAKVQEARQSKREKLLPENPSTHKGKKRFDPAGNV